MAGIRGLVKTPLRRAETLSIVMPYRDRPLPPFEVALKSLQHQTRKPYEVIIVDVASTEPYRSGMEALCEKYGAIYLYVPLDVPAKAVEVHLWNTCFNYGVRQATGDLVMYSGLDRVYEENMVECVIEYYNYCVEKFGKEAYFAGKVYNLYRTPELSELGDFDALIEEATWRGGYGYWGASREWVSKVHGLDESIRWYEDIDLTRRAKLDGGVVVWVSHGRIEEHLGKRSRVLHLADHPTGRRAHGGSDVIKVARRGKLGLRENKAVVRNDENWGIVTDEKIHAALRMVNSV